MSLSLSLVGKKLYLQIGNISFFLQSIFRQEISPEMMQEKHCDNCPKSEFAKFTVGGRSILLSHVCVCYIHSAYLSGVRR